MQQLQLKKIAEICANKVTKIFLRMEVSMMSFCLKESWLYTII